jgi:urea transporter
MSNSLIDLLWACLVLGTLSRMAIRTNHILVVNVVVAATFPFAKASWWFVKWCCVGRYAESVLWRRHD